MKILILGASGMLGHNLFETFSENDQFETFGVIRKNVDTGFFKKNLKRLKQISDANKIDEISKLLKEVSPKVVINCIGLIKQKNNSQSIADSIELNSLFPHLLHQASLGVGAKLIHFSTDCVFSGKKGNYKEKDKSDSVEIYGLSKRLGEIDSNRALTLRTSIIGHEIKSHVSLLDWFLNQEGSVKGYKKAIFSGLTTIEISKVLQQIILNNFNLSGIYHLSANSISKYDLLKLVAKIYKKNIEILEDTEVKIDRSLDSSKFSAITGYNPPSWETLIKDLNNFYNEKFKE